MFNISRVDEDTALKMSKPCCACEENAYELVVVEITGDKKNIDSITVHAECLLRSLWQVYDT